MGGAAGARTHCLFGAPGSSTIRNGVSVFTVESLPGAFDLAAAQRAESVVGEGFAEGYGGNDFFSVKSFALP